MFTIFDEELDSYARSTHEEQRAFEAGQLSAAQTSAIQLDRLKMTLRYVKANSPFYGRVLRDWSDGAISGMTPETFTRLPFTTKDDLRTHLFDVLSRPVDEAWVVYETTGTTGRATPCPRDNRDSIVNNLALTVCYDGIFRRHGERHVAAVMGPTELHSTGDTFGDVFRNLGHAVVKMWPHSPLVGFPRALQLLRDLNVTAVVCTPGMAISLAKAALKAGLDPRRDFGIRFIMALGELATPPMLANLGLLWGASVYNCMYASQEASILASCRDDGLLHTIPLNNYYEVVDPDSGSPAPARSGLREGELVITSLYQGSKPLVRYRTGDLVRMVEPAGGPYPSATLQPIGRVRDVLRLGGRQINAYDIEDTLFNDIHGCLDYQLAIDERAGQDVLTVYLEMIDDTARKNLDIARLREAVRHRLGVDSEVIFTTAGAITTTGAMVSWKAARIHDRRSPTVEPERLAALALAQARDAR